MIIAHICLLSPRLGLGRQNFVPSKLIRGLTGWPVPYLLYRMAPSPLSERFDFYLLSAEFGLDLRL